MFYALIYTHGKREKDRERHKHVTLNKSMENVKYSHWKTESKRDISNNWKYPLNGAYLARFLL